MTKQINIVAPNAVNGGTGVGIMTAAGNPWTVTAGLADELVNRAVATYVTGQPIPDTYGVPLWRDQAGTKLVKPDGTDVALGVGSGGTVEAANLAAFPATGDAAFIYAALDTNKLYIWTGSAYVEASGLPANSDAVSEGSTNLYLTAARNSGLVHTTGSESIGGVKTFTSAPVVPAASFAMLASTVKANTGGAPAAPSDITLTALAAALGVTSGGLGQTKVYKAGTLATIAISQSNVEWGRISIPANVVGANGMVKIFGFAQKVTTGTVDTPTFRLFVAPAGGVLGGTAVQAAGIWAIPASINAAAQFSSRIFGNRVDATSVICAHPQNVAAPDSTSITTAGVVTLAVPTSAAFDIIIYGSTSANDTARLVEFYAEVSNPDAASYTATFANIGGLYTDHALLAAAIAAKEDAELVDVTLTSTDFTTGNLVLTQAAHANRRLIVDVATDVTFTINNDATAGWTSKAYVRAFQKNTGKISFVNGTGTVNKSASLPVQSEQYGTVSIERTAADTFARQA